MSHPASGTFDLHLHSAPDVVPRKVDDLALARAAAEAGMVGFMLKNHNGSTVERAYLLNQVVPALKVAGSLTLNAAVGGLNPAAVDIAIRMGARCIWMPTQSATNDLTHSGKPGPGLTVLDAEDRVLPVVREILAQIARADIIMGTGHLAVREIIPLVAAAKEAGVKRITITHPELHLVNMSAGVQRDLAKQGCYLEHCLIATRSLGGSVPFDKFVANIRATGVEQSIAATDFGQANNPTPPDGMGEFVQSLQKAGFSDKEIERMARDNPMALVGF